VLFLDADMVIEIGPSFDRALLTADTHRVIQRNGSLRYPNVRLVRASTAGRFVGATHEYYCAPDGASEQLLASLTIADRNDGGSRDDKYARDQRLLEAELQRDPANHRAMFYLAQTYRGLGDRERALVAYRKRAEAGGWAEEAWYAQYAIGLILLEAGDHRAALHAFVTALRRDPRRPEPYFHLASILRTRGHHRWAIRFVRAGLALGVPADRSLFLDLDICHWGFLRELSIAGYYGGEWEAGFDANECLALGRNTPAEVATLALQNSAFYAQPLSGASYTRMGPALPAAFTPCNPSVLRTDTGYLINCRAVSYHIDANQQYHAREADGIFRTRNVLMRLDRDARFVDQTDMTCAAEPLRFNQVQGLEDCRLFAGPDGVGFTCTTLTHHPAGPVRMSLFTLTETGEAIDHRPLHGYGDDVMQKNWLPFVERDSSDLFAVYGYEPLVVLRVDQASGRCEPAIDVPQGRRFEVFRGSAGPIDLPAEHGGGRLLLVHLVAYHHRRYYLHRFLRVDDAWRVTEASRPFFFLHRGIEFACGLCLSHEGDLLVTFGSEELDAWLCRVPLAVVTGHLRPLPDWPPDAAATSA
jgi:tetratricopeptide (TPR) repeat protein